MVMLALIPLLPLAGFVINASFGRRLPKSLSGGIACASIIASFAVAASASWSVISHHEPIQQTVFTWITSGELDVPLAFRLDNLSVLMVLVVTGIGSLIHIYSTGYMHEESDSEYARYFSYLNLFASFMLILVLGASFPVMFVGWEGVGLCSYLLIGFWFRKQSAADAGKKAFVVNRVGDFGFILGMLILFWQFGTLDFQAVATAASTRPVEAAGMGVLTVATLLLFLGATGKSAQIPLYVWLPDAMEGPTPVSALIHAATMVTAGVYMIGRNAVLFEHAPITLAVVAAIGVATALMAGTIGLVQNDIKRVLAYSTVSQLGYMFLAMGVGAYAAGIFHLYTHAFFKALLFLGSGAVIHALHGEQDMRNMGGLKKYLPITYWTFLIGTLAIAGVPFLSGFFSKDEILWKTYTAEWPTFHVLLYAIALITAFLTATYMFRLFFMTFHGERRSGAHHDADSHLAPKAASMAHAAHDHDSHATHSHSAPHDAPPSMAFALIVLAIGSVLAGYVGVPHALGGENRIEAFLHPSFTVVGAAHEAEAAHHADTSTELMLMGLSVGIAAAGIGLAWFFWYRDPDRATAMQRRFKAVHQTLLNKYYVDELYDATVIRGFWATARSLFRFDAGFIDGVLVNGTRNVVVELLSQMSGLFDKFVVDGLVNGVGNTLAWGSRKFRRVQTGFVSNYALVLAAGMFALVCAFLLLRMR
jgi:NADH-quinone oxidoreductase subunit L